MKPREQRRNVLIQARMRAGATWCDAAILNLSSKGLLLHSANAPPQGSYVEVRRGQHVIIARVIWTCGERAGLSAQDRLPVEQLLCRHDSLPTESSAQCPVERRTKPRFDHRHDRSRRFSRAFEFACIALLGAFAASLVYGAVGQAMAKPLAQVSAALGD